MNEEIQKEVPTLPQYPPPDKKAIHRPGVLAKVMTKMMKLPKQGPKHNVKRVNTHRIKRKKNSPFY